jgi:peroxiredoxin
MHKNVRNFLLFFSLIFSSVAVAGNGADIKVKIGGLKDTICFLAHYYGDKQFIVDTGRIDHNGRAVFKTKEKLPGGIYLIATPSKKYFEIIIDKEQDFSVETDTLDLMNHVIVKGSQDNTYFYEYLGFIRERQKEIEPIKEKLKVTKNKDSLDLLQKQASAIDKQVKDYKINFAKDHPNSFLAVIFKSMMEPEIPEIPTLANGRKDSTFAYRYFKAHFFDNLDFSDERILRTPILYNKVKQYMETVTVQIPDSINVSADIVLDKAKANKEIFKFLTSHLTYYYESSKIMGMDGVFVHLALKYIDKNQAFWIDSAHIAKIRDRAKVLEPILIGKKCPPIIMPDTSNMLQSLYNVKAKYTVVYFWSYDCSHCKKETPVLQAMYKKMKPDGVEIFAVGTEQKTEPWKKYIKENDLNWINVSDPYYQTGFKRTFDVYQTPIIFLLDENKKIIAKRLDVENLEKILQSFIDQNKKKK